MFLQKTEKPRRKNKQFPHAVFFVTRSEKSIPFLRYFFRIHSKIKNRKKQSIQVLMLIIVETFRFWTYRKKEESAKFKGKRVLYKSNKFKYIYKFIYLSNSYIFF